MTLIFQTRYVLYDGGCRLCRRTLRLLLHYLDVLGKTVPADVAR
jgi:predicted DCC family thiol-disulfide oxidoreductase YuxK